MKTVRSERLEVTGFFSSWDAIGSGGQNTLMARNIRNQNSLLQLWCNAGLADCPHDKADITPL
jgi:hypothetical protein